MQRKLLYGIRTRTNTATFRARIPYNTTQSEQFLTNHTKKSCWVFCHSHKQFELLKVDLILDQSISYLQVNSGDQTFELPDKFIADTALNPVINTIEPKSGLPVYGGFNISINGTNLKNGDVPTIVFVGENRCIVVSLTDTDIICTVPASNSGPNSVVVDVPGKGVVFYQSLNFGFSVSSLDIDSGSFAGATEIKISGLGFGEKSDVIEVRFDEGRSKCKVASVSDSEILCLTPPASKVVAINNNGINQGSYKF